MKKSGNNIVFGTSGNDRLVGGAGDDELHGQRGSDRLLGGAGNDKLHGGAGADLLVGGAGADTYVWSQGDGADTILAAGETVAGGSDIIQIEGTFYDFDWHFVGDDLQIGVLLDGSSTFDDVGGYINLADFLNGADSIAYIEADLSLNPDEDNNPFYSPGDGLARLYVTTQGTDQGPYTELVAGTNGDGDALYTNGGYQDWVFGLSGDDTIVNNSDQTLAYLRGGEGNDQITGGAIRDNLRGDAGSDYLDGGEGQDVAGYDGETGGHGIFLNLSDSDVTALFEGSLQMVAAGHALDTFGDVDELVSIERVRGTSQDDIITGNSAYNVIFGGGGNDILYGGAGEEEIEGGWGTDALFGGGGNDIFVFRAGALNAYDIVDFEVGVDQLRFEGFAADAELQNVDGDGETWQVVWNGGSDSEVVFLTEGVTALEAGVDFIFTSESLFV
jgi:Ca2+-binding RTX toxin-like protein